MRIRLALALVGSLLLHALMLGLLPLMGGGKWADLPFARPIRLQVRMLAPAAPAEVNSRPPRPDVEARPSTTLAPQSPQQQQAAVRKQPALAVTTIVPQGEPAGAQGDVGTSMPPVASSPDRTAAVPGPAPPLNLSITTAKLPPRTALQNSIEQQAIRPDAIARVFERVVDQTPPVTTEITQTVDSHGRVTVKVRTPWSTYCVSNSTPPGATLYDLKALAGNCPR